MANIINPAEVEQILTRVSFCSFFLAGAGDREVMTALEKIALPIVKEFDPQLIVVSAGFDGASQDPIGGFNVRIFCSKGGIKNDRLNISFWVTVCEFTRGAEIRVNQGSAGEELV